MDFGKVSSSQLSKIDFSLPAQDPRAWVRLNALENRMPKRLRVGVGCPVWNVPQWMGSVYPRGIKQSEYLEYYSRQFNSIELNTTHYRIPDLLTIERWKKSVPDDFRFCPKFPQSVSHHLHIALGNSEANEFTSHLMQLENKLGLSFLQLPPHFGAADLPLLRKFLKSLPQDFPVAVEVRHPSLFEENRLIDSLDEILTQARAHVVITDVSGRRDVLHSTLTSKKALVRFVGNALHPTDYTRIAEWVTRLYTWIEMGLEEIEFFVHEPESITSPDLIRHFIDLLNHECRLNLRQWIPQQQGEQLSLL